MDKVEYLCPSCKKTRVIAEFIERKEELAKIFSSVGCPECLHQQYEETYSSFTCKKCEKIYYLVRKEIMWILSENDCCLECTDKKMKSLGLTSNLYETALRSGAIEVEGITEREEFLRDVFIRIVFGMSEKDGIDSADITKEYLLKNKNRVNFYFQEVRKGGEISKEEQEKLFWMFVDNYF